MSDEKPTCEHQMYGRHEILQTTPSGKFIGSGKWCSGPVIATEPETPVPDAMCEVHLEKDGRLRISVRVRPDQMYATLSALQSPASDPTPDLRERILAALYVADYGDLLNWAADSVAGRKNMVRRLDAVLVVLGEPK